MAHAAGRLVSVLEGGYQITGGGVSSLAAGVASHVGTLMSPSLVGATWNPQAALDRFEKVAAIEPWGHDASRSCCLSSVHL